MKNVQSKLNIQAVAVMILMLYIGDINFPLQTYQ